MEFQTIKDVVLFALAIYAACLSTFNLLQSIRKDRRKIKVSFTTAFPTYPNGALGPALGQIIATNEGQRPVTVTNLTLRTPNDHDLLMVGRGLPGLDDTRLPAKLSDGQSAHCFIGFREIASAFAEAGFSKAIKLTPICIDSVGGVHSGQPIEVDPAKYARM